MSLRRWPSRDRDLARFRLVPAAGHRGRDRLLRSAALAAALFAGAAGSHLYWHEQLTLLRQDAAPMKDLRHAEQALSRTGLQLQMSVAHGRELEHQIDGLNLRLRECLEEVSFFREGRGAKR
jgi:hypothetical protein